MTILPVALLEDSEKDAIGHDVVRSMQEKPLNILHHIRDADRHFEGLLSCGVDNCLSTRQTR